MGPHSMAQIFDVGFSFLKLIIPVLSVKVLVNVRHVVVHRGHRLMHWQLSRVVLGHRGNYRERSARHVHRGHTMLWSGREMCRAAMSWHFQIHAHLHVLLDLLRVKVSELFRLWVNKVIITLIMVNMLCNGMHLQIKRQRVSIGLECVFNDEGIRVEFFIDLLLSSCGTCKSKRKHRGYSGVVASCHLILYARIL